MSQLQLIPLVAEKVGEPRWLSLNTHKRLCGEGGEALEGGPCPPTGREERVKTHHLPFVFSASALSDENVPPCSRRWKHVKQRDISQTNPVMSISPGREEPGWGALGGWHNLLK